MKDHQQEFLRTMPHEPRYQVMPWSESGHCCFGSTVVDTTSLEVLDTGYILVNRIVCECFEHDDAVRIAEELNR